MCRCRWPNPGPTTWTVIGRVNGQDLPTPSINVILIRRCYIYLYASGANANTVLFTLSPKERGRTISIAMECALNDDNLRDTELRLGLPGADDASKKSSATRSSKRALVEGEHESHAKNKSLEEVSDSGSDQETPRTKAQVVGWPPIRSYRRNNSGLFRLKKDVQTMGLYVKVSMDGVPYLRKIDLKMYKSYKELKEALDDMFKYFSLGEVAKKESDNEGYEYDITYEDKDRDLMLVGDVPWEMFISSCTRLRIMKRCEARGLQSKD